ncbi:MAG: CDP-glycerol glycerophosphotransferase family protein [Ignavibacteriales bacterium]|nr:CDP-glycerol glycerophosphotransferase family protein [Ignavibacteriales bacterium]
MKILFICGSLNQTTMMYEISKHFKNEECFFTPYYTDGFLDYFVKKGILDFTILGGQAREKTENFLKRNNLKVDYKGMQNDYDLVYTCSDLIIPKNIQNKKIILVQEGMTNKDTLTYYLTKYLKLPRYLGDTAMFGQSNKYDLFCVASEGYKDFFVNRGAEQSKISVTGIPNFDNFKKYYRNNFPYKSYALVATSDQRETLHHENRKQFIKNAVEIAEDKQLIFKLHPNENFNRAIKEINKYAPGSLIYTSGNINEMIANCDILITRYSSVVYVGLALNKEVYSDFEIETLKKLLPIQNNGQSAFNIAEVGYQLLYSNIPKPAQVLKKYKLKRKLLSKAV